MTIEKEVVLVNSVETSMTKCPCSSIMHLFYNFCGFCVFQEAEEFERSWLLLADIYIQVCSSL